MSSSDTSLRRVMGVPSLVIFGLAYMVPLTVFTTYGLVAVTTGGHVPTAYLVTLIAMLFTAFSYAALVKAFPRAGSAYTYARRAFGGHVGFLTGWSLMIDYLLLPLINYVLMGIYLNAQLPGIPPWVFALAGVVLITGLNVVGITVVRNANLVLVGLQLVFAAVFVVCAVLHVAQNPGVSLLQPLYDAGLTFPGLLAGAAMLALSFLGFDAISTLSEEARDPERTVPRAIILTTIIGGLIFTVIAYVSTLVIPRVADLENPDAAANQIMEVAAGRWLEVFFLIAYIAGCIAAALASQASVARILFAMGRDGVLPAFFARLSPRYQTPVGAALFVGVVSLAALVADLNTVASLISFGALAAFSLVNLSVIKHFLIDERRRGGAAILRFGVLPALGFALTAWLWFSLSALALTVGLVWIGVGIVWLAVLTRGFRRRPPEVEFDDEAPAPERIVA
ncbi:MULTISPECIES: APC family permease [unclassified Microbacterium]|uniref:APC family permease n=1 Tax=unclassified Microbacterium TaxID=2609290 RepID=UPI0006F23286|nr:MULTISPECIES: APC family permease [unclassified Microbacterium]AOX45570.1 Putrescine importer PuuP [Microbacterium sp. BH-3-3-3]KQR88761.1 Putrescine importer PuuP [Microbacterium sp. Leaf179]MBD8478067.1 APC family permease [Microbacterium sp. CFBP 8794]